MVNIKLDSSYSIGSDSLQWMLIENGRYVGFYTTLQGCVEAFFNRKTRQSNAINVNGLLEFQKGVIRRLQQALTPLDIRVEGVNSEVRPRDIKEDGK